MTSFHTDKKKLLTNFCSLSLVEVANYLFPLLTLPYLVRVLGPDKFGLIAFVQAFVQYFVLFTDYGFNLSATRNISIKRNNPREISEIFSSVLVIKMLFLTVSFIILISLVLLIPRFRPNLMLFIFSFGAVLGNVLFPIWLFQGMEKMKFIAMLNLIAKLIFVAAIFLFIKTHDDYVLVPLINSLGGIVAGSLSLIIVFSVFKVKFSWPKVEQIAHELREGWHIFISTSAISLYTTSNTVILGFLTSNTIVGYYSAAEKIIRSSQRLLNPVSQTLYPHISKLVADSRLKAVKFIRKTLFIVGSLSLVVSITIFGFSAFIVHVFLGYQFQESISVLKVLAFLPFIITLSNIFGVQTMLTFNMKELLPRILISAGIINVVLALVLVPCLRHVGTAISVLIAESYVTVAMYFTVRKIILSKP